MSIIKTTGHASLGYSLRFLLVLVVIGSLILFASNLIGGQLFWFKSIESRGSVKKINVGVYWDGNCSSTVEEIDWGDIAPGLVKNVSLFIRNEGTVAAVLFLSTSDWSPSNAFEFITLRWDYNGQTLDLFEIVPIILTLQVSPNIMGIKSFSLDIIISASD